jgi:ribonuclease Z
VSTQVIEIYGPLGTRELVRTTLRISYSTLSSRYRVHELLYEDESPYGEGVPLHHSEAEGGQNIRIGTDGTWTVLQSGDVHVRAAPIRHTGKIKSLQLNENVIINSARIYTSIVRCLGYVVSEQAQPERLDAASLLPLLERNRAALAAQGVREPRSLLGVLQKKREPITLPDGSVLEPPALSRKGRKIVILGDTYDASTIVPIAMDADLLVHECTNAYLPGLDARPEDTEASVRSKAKSRGHSTPEVRADLFIFIFIPVVASLNWLDLGRRRVGKRNPSKATCSEPLFFPVRRTTSPGRTREPRGDPIALAGCGTAR